jgi:hypothetical protein
VAEVPRCGMHNVPLLGLSRHRPTPSRTPPRSCTVSPPSISSATRRPNFTHPQAAAAKHHSTSSSKKPRRAPRVARRGASSATMRPQPWPTMMVVAPSWCTPRLSQTMASVRHDSTWTTLRSSLRRLVRTIPSLSSTSSGIAA